MSGLYSEGGREAPAPGMESLRKRVRHASHPLHQVGTKGFWEYLEGQVHFFFVIVQ